MTALLWSCLHREIFVHLSEAVAVGLCSRDDWRGIGMETSAVVDAPDAAHGALLNALMRESRLSAVN